VQSSGAVPLHLLSEDAVVELAAVLVRQQLVDVEIGRAPVGEGTTVITTAVITSSVITASVIAASVITASVITTFCATSVLGPVTDLKYYYHLSSTQKMSINNRLEIIFFYQSPTEHQLNGRSSHFADQVVNPPRR
jgi:hypothetical protein